MAVRWFNSLLSLVGSMMRRCDVSPSPSAIQPRYGTAPPTCGSRRHAFGGCVAVVLTAFASTVAVANDHLDLDAAAAIERETLRQYVETLAGDVYEGRAAGTRGGRAAAYYLLTVFEKLGLQPAGKGDRNYFQLFGNQCQNILGIIPGSDPVLRREVVVVGAHFDHVGFGTPSDSRGVIGQIHNGADDNASGVAVLLELAEAFRHLPTAPRRSILFALWDCEENALSGSSHWVANPTVPLECVTLACNLDMVGKLGGRKLEVIGWRSQAGLRRMVVEQNHLTSLPLDFNWQIRRSSDHYSFFNINIPIVMFHTGLHDDYHRPGDDAEKLDYAGMERIGRLVFGTVRALADRNETPSFRPAVHQESAVTRLAIEEPSPAPAGRLGIDWELDDDRDELRVTRVEPDSAAQQAGLHAGDKLLNFGGNPLNKEADLDCLIVTAPQRVNLVVRRPDGNDDETRVVQLRGEPTRIGFSWREDSADPGALVVVGIIPNSPASRSGLRTADRIYQVDGESFRSEDEFRHFVSNRPLPLPFLIERDGLLQTVIVPASPAVAQAVADIEQAGD